MKPFQFILNAVTQSVHLGGIKSTTITLVVLLSIFLPFKVSAQSYDLTGYWQSDAGGCYQIRQNGNEVFWAGGPIGSASVHNVFHGAIAGNTLTGLWYDLPANPYQAFGASLSVRIESNNRIVKVSESAPYRASAWTRTNGTCNTTNAGGQVSQPAAGGSLTGEWNIKCCNDELGWTLQITNHDGNNFSGSFSGGAGDGTVNGQVRGNTIEFVRSGGWGKQQWSAQLVNDGGGLRMINGSWTGDYLDRYPGKNNWHAEKKR
jgi:hypothetical protein